MELPDTKGNIYVVSIEHSQYYLYNSKRYQSRLSGHPEGRLQLSGLVLCYFEIDASANRILFRGILDVH